MTRRRRSSVVSRLRHLRLRRASSSLGGGPLREVFAPRLGRDASRGREGALLDLAGVVEDERAGDADERETHERVSLPRLWVGEPTARGRPNLGGVEASGGHAHGACRVANLDARRGRAGRGEGRVREAGRGRGRGRGTIAPRWEGQGGPHRVWFGSVRAGGHPSGLADRRAGTRRVPLRNGRVWRVCDARA